MRWGYLFFAATYAGLLEISPYGGLQPIIAFCAVILFGLFMDDTLKRHRP